MGLVGRTLMGKSQLKVSTPICSTPAQVTASDWLPRTKQVPEDSPDVTNSKCSLHFRDTVGKRGVSSPVPQGTGTAAVSALSVLARGQAPCNRTQL